MMQQRTAAPRRQVRQPGLEQAQPAQGARGVVLGAVAGVVGEAEAEGAAAGVAARARQRAMQTATMAMAAL